MESVRQLVWVWNRKYSLRLSKSRSNLKIRGCHLVQKLGPILTILVSLAQAYIPFSLTNLSNNLKKVYFILSHLKEITENIHKFSKPEKAMFRNYYLKLLVLILIPGPMKWFHFPAIEHNLVNLGAQTVQYGSNYV